jgi:two-component system response regulator QseB
MRILLVEDDRMIAEAVRKGLRGEGWAVDWVGDGAAALLAVDVAPEQAYDLILLDLGLPKCTGIEVLQQLRAGTQHIPVLILTARDAVHDRVKGLDAGADDYLVKPFDLDELAARIRAVLRRQAGRSSPVIQHGPITLDLATRQVMVSGELVALSAREFALLHALLVRPGAILSKAQLEEKIYGWGEEVGSNTVEVYIHALRKKINPKLSPEIKAKIGTDIIRTIRGLGYTLVECGDS